MWHAIGKLVATWYMCGSSWLCRTSALAPLYRGDDNDPLSLSEAMSLLIPVSNL